MAAHYAVQHFCRTSGEPGAQPATFPAGQAEAGSAAEAWCRRRKMKRSTLGCAVAERQEVQLATELPIWQAPATRPLRGDRARAARAQPGSARVGVNAA